MPFTLKILGGASLIGPEGPLTGRVAQRRQLALLSLLALAPGSGASREKLIGILWSETETERARQYLSIGVYAIRQALGQDAVVGQGDDLRLNLERVRVDAVEFGAALQREEVAAAVEWYDGPLLDGFYLDGAPEFERWAEAERQQMERQFRAALETLASEATSLGDSKRAVELWRRLAVQDPLSTRVALGLMNALATSGDRAGALQHARVHATLLREELELEPDPEVIALADRLRAAQSSSLPPSPPPSAGLPAPATAPEVAPVPESQPVVPLPFPLPHRPRRRFGPRRVAVLSLLAAGAALLLVAQARSPEASGDAVADVGQAASDDVRPTVAVLDLADLSSDTLDAYVTDALSEEITARLSRIPWLRVKSRSVLTRLPDRAAADPITVGRSLGVGFLVEGSVRRAGDRLRIGVRLTSTEDGFQLWSEEFSGRQGDLLDLHERIAARVVERIGGKLYPWDRAILGQQPTESAIAYDHYLRGNHYLARRTPDDVRRAIIEYDAAVRLDSGFTAALSRQAYAYALFPDWGWEFPGASHEELVGRGLAITERALRREPRSPEAWLARAYLLVQQDPFRLRGVPEALERVIALDPTNAEVFHQYGQTLMILGRDAEATAAYEQALLLEPHRVLAMVPLAAIHFHRGEIGEAVRWIDRAVSTDSSVAYARAVRALLRLHVGDLAGARAEAEAALRLDPSYPVPALAMLARVLAREGDEAAAYAEVAAALRSSTGGGPHSPTAARFLGSALVEMGRTEEALALLEGVRPQGAWLWFYLHGPDFDRIRAHPRFVAVVQGADPRS